MIPSHHRAALAALIDRIVPVDDYPSATEAGVLQDLDMRSTQEHARLWARALQGGLESLAREALHRFGFSFETLAGGDQDSLIEALEAGQVLTDWPVPPADFVRHVTRVVMESYYGNLEAPSWRMTGYDAAPKRDPGGDFAHVVPTTTPFAQVADQYDVLVIGSGAGGGVVAGLAAEAGAKVLLVERGRNLGYGDMVRDHLRNHRLALYGHNTGPESEGNPRVFVDANGRERVIREPYNARWYNIAMAVGGGTRVYQGMAWRFLPQDFRMASTYGVPEGSSLADWPIRYDDLEPYYTRAEWEIGVAGDATQAVQGYRSKPYPLPPPPWNAEGRRLKAGADKLGWSTAPVPLLINTEPRLGRGRCVQCGECVGFPCPSNAKNGSFNTLIPRALASGNCQLVAGCRAMRIETDIAGKVTGVELLDVATGVRKSVRAKHVAVACGAVETARLLLHSTSGREPTGLGNRTDQVGRHLQGHIYGGGFGVFDEPIIEMAGPGARISTCDFNHGTPEVIGGGVLHNEVIKLPILHWFWALPPDLRRWGLENKRGMRELYTRTSHVWGPIQETPHANSRVTLAHDVLDAHGMPVARLHGPLHPETLRTTAVQRDRALQWLEASGAKRTWGAPIVNELTAGQHQAGTCRMGDDPATSVTDAWGRVHGHDNLWVVDGSVHVTNGGFNPVLNIYALAFRNGEKLAAS